MKTLTLTKVHVIAELRSQIKVFKNSYREADGVIRDLTALRSIDCLEIAIECVRDREGDARWEQKHKL